MKRAKKGSRLVPDLSRQREKFVLVTTDEYEGREIEGRSFTSLSEAWKECGRANAFYQRNGMDEVRHTRIRRVKTDE